MAGRAQSEAVLGALHPTLPVYAVVDCARRNRILPWLLGTRAPSWCLYRARRGESLPGAILAVAPQLLRLGRGHAYTDEFFARGWGDSWGFAFASASSPLDLRRHLRRFLRVQTEARQILAFRYYDPRVLRAFLPTCTAAEVAAFFGPIAAVAAPAATAGRFHLYRPGKDGLEERQLVAGEAGESVPQENCQPQ